MSEKTLPALKKQKFDIAPYVLLLPALALFAIFTFYPFLKTVYLSFGYTDKKGNYVAWAGFENFVRVVTDDIFGKIMSNTFRFALMIGCGTLFISMIFALISAAKEKGSRVYEVMYAIPMAVASVPASVVFSYLFKLNNGLINQLLGTEIAWLQDPKYAMYTVAFITVWLHIGSSYIFLLVGFRNVPEELVECATLDGAGPVRKALKIFIPIASPQIFFVIFLNINNSFKAFGQIKLLTSGGPNNSTKTIIYQMYENAMVNQRYETACVDALILFIILLVCNRIQNALEDKVVFYK